MFCFGPKNMCNQVQKQQQLQGSNGASAIEYLHWLSLNDSLMFVLHIVDEEKRVQHVFWYMPFTHLFCCSLCSYTTAFHFQRVIHYKRYKEVQADFKSIIDTLVALTEFVSIVRSIGKLYTCSKCFKMFFVPHLLLVLCMVGRFVDHKV